MTVTTDAKKRIVLPSAAPGDVFDVQIAGEGKVILTKLVPIQSLPAKVRIEKRNGYSVGVLENPVDIAALKQALAEFP